MASTKATSGAAVPRPKEVPARRGLVNMKRLPKRAIQTGPKTASTLGPGPGNARWRSLNGRGDNLVQL
ncbi:hypothetical protein N7523_010877 [Penicillium sp. IBT 18751x]|nr:hypothetical protein N7523_010877 [Penicillium sp. IBT 18751x]